MTQRRTRLQRVRAQLDEAREGLGALNAFVDLLHSVPPVRRARPSSSSSSSSPVVIDLVEVRPGVFAAPTTPAKTTRASGHAAGLGMLDGVIQALDAYDHVSTQAAELGKGAPWRKAQK